MNTTTDWHAALDSYNSVSYGDQIMGRYTFLALDPASFGTDVFEARTRAADWFYAAVTFEGRETETVCGHRHTSADVAVKCQDKLLKSTLALVALPTFECHVTGTVDQGARPVTVWCWGEKVFKKGYLQHEDHRFVTL